MATTEFPVSPQEEDEVIEEAMDEINGSKIRALIFGYPISSSTTADTNVSVPIKTCWPLKARAKRSYQNGHDENHRNVNVQSTSVRTTRTTTSRSASIRSPSVRHFPSHVFRESSLIMLVIISIFSTYFIRPGSGLHPPQCQWSLYQDIERLNCLVETGNSLIVEEEVHGIGPEHAKSLWVQCSDSSSSSGSDIFVPPSTNSNSNSVTRTDSGNGDSNYYSPSTSALGTEGVSQHASNSGTSNNNANPGGFVLSHGVFMAVPNLRELRLENCKIAGITPGALSYLPYLQNLTIRSQTSLASWPSSSSSLEVKTGVLRGLNELIRLDLSTTRLNSLPNDFLCFLPSLKYLNLSSCFLRDFRAIGIVPSDPTNPQNCESQIKILDLSSNNFSLLPPATFAGVKKLEELRIDYNSITIAAERALLGLHHLKIISLAGNMLTSLPPEFFKDNRQIHEIYLQNNSISVLAPGLFAGLKHLAILDLSHNELTSEWVNGETFRGLENLFALNLASNSLMQVDSVLFRDLRFLQMLNLEQNKISHIAEDAFTGMPNLYTLVLSRNHLKNIDSICNGLHGLSFLSLDGNLLENVAPESFKNCSGLVDLNLSSNKLHQVPQAFSLLTNLRTLDLGENNITDVGNASYQALPNLYGLRLTDNSINFIPSSAFANMPNLKIVNLAKNNISVVSPGAFDKNPNLQAIRLDNNKLTSISGLFQNVHNLLWLNISANFLEFLKYEELPIKLQWLDLRSNKISSLGNCMGLDNRIRNLDLSENYITEIGSSNFPDSIENLVVTGNRIHHVQPYTFYRKDNLSRIDLSHNMIVHLEQTALRLSPERASRVAPSAEIFLGFNPLQCDCSMEWLQQMNSDETSGQYPIIQDVEDVKCTLSFDRIYEATSYLSIHSSQFLCKYESHCFKTCQCCEYDACDCKMTCPKNCTCYHDQAWTTNLVDCSMLEMSNVRSIPVDVTEARLDGNVITSLESHSFIGRKNLRVLFLNSSNIEVLNPRWSSGLRALEVLHLENNFIETLEGHEFDELENLESLFLQFNSISYIANDTFASLHKLRVLRLHNNNIFDLAIWNVVKVGRFDSSLMDITLRGNDWSCECDFATRLKGWLTENRAKISDAGQVHCVDQVSISSSSPSSRQSNPGSGSQVNSNNTNSGSVVTTQTKSQTELVVVRLLDQKNHRCTSSHSNDLSILEPTRSTNHKNNTNDHDEFDLAEYVPWLVCIPIFGVILVLILISSYYWRQSLRVWLHSHCGLRLGSCRESPAERDKLFDAFVSYSSKDEAWVRQVLAAELERNDPPYRLCLRYRDLPSGGSGTYLADSLVQGSDCSKRTIVVLTHHFLKGEWSRTDVKSAHHSVLKDRHRKVIIILLGDLPNKELDPDIRLYLKNHTYLNCEDKKFWEKLRYALPDVKVKVPVFRGIHGRTSSARNSSQHTTQRSGAAGPPMQPPAPPLQHQFLHPHHTTNTSGGLCSQHHLYNQPSPNLSHAHHLTHLGPNTQNNMTSPLMGPPPPPPLTAPPVPGLLANLPPNIPNGTLSGHHHHSHHHHHGGISHGGGSGPMTTILGPNGIGGSTASISTSSNNSGSQRAAQRHPNLVNSANPNNRQNAIHI